MVSGETHYYLGRRYRLRVVMAPGARRLRIAGMTTLELRVPAGTETVARRRVLDGLYRRTLRDMIPPLLEKWQPVLGVAASAWGLKRMKTRWGGCNPDARRIWFNVDLAKKPAPCLEYLVVHELAHLIERHHSDGFTTIMDKHLPHWRLHREELNAAPLGDERWGY
jgi:predicted metal-dependent hydrolase